MVVGYSSDVLMESLLAEMSDRGFHPYPRCVIGSTSLESKVKVADADIHVPLAMVMVVR